MPTLDATVAPLSGFRYNARRFGDVAEWLKVLPC